MEADCKVRFIVNALTYSSIILCSSNQQMSGRYTALAEQKVYLNEQLKAIMKRNRVLQAEIDYATQGQMGDDNPYQLGEGGIALNRSSASQSIQDEEEDAYIMDDSGDRRGKPSHGSKLFGERSSQFKSSSDIPSSLSVSVCSFLQRICNFLFESCPIDPSRPVWDEQGRQRSERLGPSYKRKSWWDDRYAQTDFGTTGAGIRQRLQYAY
jgi:hypothetical protein